MAQQKWKEYLTKANNRLNMTIRQLSGNSRSSWLELAATKVQLQQAREDLDRAINILDQMKSVRDAEACLSITPTDEGLTIGAKHG